MANDVSIKFGVEGEKTFKSALSAINAQVKAIDEEFKTSVAQMANADDKEKALAQSTLLLTQKQAAQEEQIKALTEKVKAGTEAYAAIGKKIEEVKSKGEEYEGQLQDLEIAWNNQATSVNKSVVQLEKAKQGLEDTKGKMKDLPGSIKETGDNMEDASKKASIFGDVLSAKVVGDAVIAGFKELVKLSKELAFGAAEYADNIRIMSSVSGIGTDKLQEFAYMSDLVDVSLETITGSLTKLTKNMDTARKGTGDMAEAFKTLGIKVTDNDGLLRDSETVFYELLTTLNAIPYETERDAYALQIFGKSARELNPLIEAGSEKMRELAKEAHDVGYVMSSENLSANNDLQDSLDRLNSSFIALKNTIGTQLAPTIQGLVDDTIKMLRGIEDPDTLGSIAGNMIIGLMNGIAKKAPDLITYVGDVLISVLKTFTDNMDAFVNSGKNMLIGVMNGIAEKLPKIVTTGTEVIISFIKGLVKALPDLLTAVGDIVTSMYVALQQEILTLSSKFGTVGKTIGSLIVGGMNMANPAMANAAKNLMAKYGDAAKTSAKEELEDLGVVVEEEVADVFTPSPTLIQDIINAGKAASSAYAEGVESGKDEVESAIESVIELPFNLSSVISDFTSLFTAFSTGNYISAITYIIRSIEDVLNLFDNIESFFNRIEEAISNIVDKITPTIELSSNAFDRIGNLLGSNSTRIENVITLDGRVLTRTVNDYNSQKAVMFG